MTIHSKDNPAPKEYTWDTYRRNLAETFNKYLVDLVPSEKREGLKVLSVGCGLGYEAGAVLKVFPNASYRGIDIDKGSINGAIEINEDLGSNVQFEVANALDPSVFGEGNLPLIIFRNPQIGGSVLEQDLPFGGIQKIIQNSISALDSQGLLFVTLNSGVERRYYLAFLKTLPGVDVVLDERNDFSTKGETFEDPFVVIARKK